VLTHLGGLEWGSAGGQVAAVVGAEVVAAGEGFSADETVSATRGPTSGSLALIACPRPSSGDAGGALSQQRLPEVIAAVVWPPGAEVVVAADGAGGDEPTGVCHPAGPPMWRLFIPAGVEPEFRL
jgi:hypothetical protein